MFFKKRAWFENVGRLVVISMTIIIAVGVVGLFWHFFMENRQSAVDMSVLASSTDNSEALLDLWICENPGSIDINAIANTYELSCDLVEKKGWFVIDEIDEILVIESFATGAIYKIE